MLTSFWVFMSFCLFICLLSYSLPVPTSVVVRSFALKAIVGYYNTVGWWWCVLVLVNNTLVLLKLLSWAASTMRLQMFIKGSCVCYHRASWTRKLVVCFLNDVKLLKLEMFFLKIKRPFLTFTNSDFHFIAMIVAYVFRKNCRLCKHTYFPFFKKRRYNQTWGRQILFEHFTPVSKRVVEFTNKHIIYISVLIALKYITKNHTIYCK